MSNLIDLTGQKFGRLTVINRAENVVLPCGQQKTRWLCHCDCGNEIIVISDGLKRGHTRSCGCLNQETRIIANTKHGLRRTRIYKTWESMKARCYNKNDEKYPRYGARGIIVCDEWRNDFQTFYDWAMSHGYRNDLQIDRIDNNGNYCPENCRWVNRITQANNKSNNQFITYKGETKTIAEWSRERGIKYETLRQRLNRYNWSVEKAFEIK